MCLPWIDYSFIQIGAYYVLVLNQSFLRVIFCDRIFILKIEFYVGYNCKWNLVKSFMEWCDLWGRSGVRLAQSGLSTDLPHPQLSPVHPTDDYHINQYQEYT